MKYALIAIVLLAACDTHTAVDVTLRLSGAAAQRAAELKTLDLTVEGDSTPFQRSIDVAGKFQDGSADFEYRPGIKSGPLTFTVTVKDAAGALVGGARDTATVRTNKTVSLTMTIGDDIPDGGFGDGFTGDVAINPPMATLIRTRTQQFMADADVEWTADDGIIDANGLFTAPGPLTTTTVHVVATRKDDPTKKGTVVVTVVPYMVEALAGKIGGAGNADGVGPTARFSRPHGSASNGKGTLLISDTTIRNLRTVDIATGKVTFLAGGDIDAAESVDGMSAAARFTNPTGVAFDGTGAAYVTDVTRIRKVDLQTGAVTTFAGSATAGNVDGNGAAAQFRVADGITFDANNQMYLYVADSTAHTIRRITIADAQVTTIAGADMMAGQTDGVGTAARFNAPQGVGYLNDRLYVADSANHTIRLIQLTNNNAVSNFAGTALMTGTADGFGEAARFNTPTDVSTDGNLLFVADRNNMTIRSIRVDTRGVTTIAGVAMMSGSDDGTPGRFYSPYRLAFAMGGLFVTDWNVGGNSAVRRYDVASKALSTAAGTSRNNGFANGVGEVARFFNVYGVAADDQGNAYAADGANQNVRKIVLATGETSTFRATGAGQGPYGFAITPTNLYVSLTFRPKIMVIPLANPGAATYLGSDTPGTGSGAFEAVTDVCADGTMIYATDKHRIREINTTNNAFRDLAGAPGDAGAGYVDATGAAARFDTPADCAADGAGNLYVADQRNHVIRKIVIATGVVSTFAGTAMMSGNTDGTGTAAKLSSPNAIAYDPVLRSLYVGSSSRVRRIAIDTAEVTTFIGDHNRGIKTGPPPAGLNGVGGIGIIPGGDILIGSPNENAVLLVRTH